MTINTLNVENRSKVKTRFAPSPTGAMHLGNLRTALFSYLYAKKHYGKFILRIENTDRERSKDEYVINLINDLQSLGLNWDEPVVYQSERMPIYEEFFNQLLDQDLIYRCFCSEIELDRSRKLQLSRGIAPKYTRNCLNLTEEEINQRLHSAVPHCWRFKVPKDLIIEFNDLIKGKQTFNSNEFGDFVIRRQDGIYSFMFCSVLDDVLQGVSHVLRGADHVSNTPRQLLILKSLDQLPPQYGHFSLLSGNDADSPKLSKRSGSESIKDLLVKGYLPKAILNYLARLGHNYVDLGNNLLNLNELAAHFEISKISVNASKHDSEQLNFWQKQAILSMDLKELTQTLMQNSEFKQLVDLNSPEELVEFLTLIKNNILFPEEAIDWYKVLNASNLQDLGINNTVIAGFKELDQNFFKVILNCNNVNNLIEELCLSIGSKKLIFTNLRLMLTGKHFGPELPKIMKFLGLAKIKQRAQQIIELIVN